MLFNNAVIRRVQPGDEPELLQLMEALAEFEGYSEAFCVSEPALTQVLFETEQVEALVAEQDQRLVGMLVYYRLPFSYDLKPWWYIKELYVAPAYRSQQLGREMMQSLITHCRQQGGSKIRWDVLSNNHYAQDFYRALGAKAELHWQLFSLSLN
ncbi:GNAT family N-acetyltransferase [Vibrio marisflavi]|uniref:N-acetyltransferase domain-containing protein n=1 Tax=Vibrio marisflavi CECT 7928 TaxID=634439 RepID=A0ABM9AAI3_9VIBR|nr:GNAT family N-acetyltransferase [Vibrio marisflavi]CAH0543196.1 hypothetical protein VMF7928_04461 [Vibrio marisflavi CECT 7928]